MVIPEKGEPAPPRASSRAFSPHTVDGASFESDRRASLEVRINAEDPENNFRPSPGKITKLRIPGGRGVRFDSHVHEGYVISPYYDSMIGKLIVHRPTRAEAIACMLRALDEFVIEGVSTSIPLLRQILRDPTFQAGQVDTRWLERTIDQFIS